MKKMKTSIFVILVLVILFSAVGSMYIVKENEYASVMRFSKVTDIKSEPGLYIRIPFLDSIAKLPKNQMIYDLNPSEVITADKKTLVVDSYTVWKIDDPLRFIQTVAYTTVMEERLNVAVYNAVKNTLGGINQTDIINAGDSSRAAVNNTITEQINSQLANYGVSVISTEIKRLDLPQDNEEAVCKRMITEREQMAASYIADGKYEAKKIENETDKQVQITISEAKATSEKLRGEGENQYMKILAEAYNTPEKADFYEFIRTLEAAKKSFTGEKTLILDKDSPIVKIFYQK
ncbi:Modulator of FtsH protease HflC [bioreactor metagenome]|uniref:Modulator of FtsH protease HflC n=1 Tax=bioreactor metagenome TaxID=1076179 RepID=A0A645B4K6_9ZZZZ